MLNIIIGAIIIALTAAVLIFAICKTPRNLRGFYTVFYSLFAILLAATAVYLIVDGLFLLR